MCCTRPDERERGTHRTRSCARDCHYDDNQRVMTALRETPEGIRQVEANAGDGPAAKEQRVRTTTVTWRARPDLSREEWERAGLKSGGVSRSTSWGW